MSGLFGSVFTGTSRRPRLRVLANGAEIAGVRDAEVLSNNIFAADRFSIGVALGADPVWSMAAWASTGFVMIDVQMGFLPDLVPDTPFAGTPPLAWVSLVQGAADTIDIDPIAGTARIEGRDLTAVFIDAPIQESFANRTASEIAALLAARHNLAAQVTPTTTPVGRYYDSEHDQITLNQFATLTTEWALLVWLAQQESFDVFVRGNTLFFQPPAQAAVPEMVLTPGAAGFGAPGFGSANIASLRMARTLTLAGDIIVTVKSWSAADQAAYTETVTSTGTAPFATPQSYVFVRPNLTPDQALQLAQRKLAELTQHERVIEISMPGELTLTPRSRIALAGTATAFDQVYAIEEIERRLDVEHGFSQRIRAKNASPLPQATPPGAQILNAPAN